MTMIETSSGSIISRRNRKHHRLPAYPRLHPNYLTLLPRQIPSNCPWSQKRRDRLLQDRRLSRDPCRARLSAKLGATLTVGRLAWMSLLIQHIRQSAVSEGINLLPGVAELGLQSNMTELRLLMRN